MNTVAIVIAFIFSFIAGYKYGMKYGSHMVMRTMVDVGRRQYRDFDKKMAQGLLADINNARKVKGKEPLKVKKVN